VTQLEIGDPISFIVFCATVGTMGVAALCHWALTRRRRLNHPLRKLRHTAISDARDGVIKFVGRVRLLADPLIAPVSERRCAGYKVVVLESNGEDTSTVVDEVRCVDFLLDDGTGVAWIRAARADLEVIHDAHLSSGLLADAPGHLETLLLRHGQKSTKWAGIANRTLRYSEGALEAGEEVVVCGVGRWEPDPDPRHAIGYRDSAMRFVVSSLPDAAMLISDDPDLISAGRVSPHQGSSAV
jgi:hypothetical protein